MCDVFFSTVLERKMSMRRPREELIEQGVLRELPENGIHSVCLCVCACMYSVSIIKYSAHNSSSGGLSLPGEVVQRGSNRRKL